jgi:hypothetical protein
MGEKWPGIIGWFVTIKCWIILLYSKAWVSWNCSHDEEEIITIIGSFLDRISWRSCREIISHEIWCGCCYFDLEYELCFSSKVSRRKRRMRYTGRRNDRLISNESEEKGIAIWWDGLWFQLGSDFINLFEWMLREENSFE